MRYLLAIVLPPLAVLLCGKLFTSLFSAALYVAGVVLSVTIFPVGLGLLLIAVIHAMMVVSSHKADVRSRRVEKTVARAQDEAARRIGKAVARTGQC